MRIFLKSLLLGLLVLATACSMRRKEENQDGPLRAQIPVATRDGYSLQIVDLLTLTGLADLSGSAARFVLDPELNSGVLQGHSPHLQYFRNVSGVVIPTDTLSLQLLTMYSHYERLQQLDQKTGAGGLLSYPRTVAVNTNFKDADGTPESNNALYSGKLDALIMVPYTEQGLPIMANGGVIGHEHFHSIFQKIVIDNLKDKYPLTVQTNPHLQESILKTAEGEVANLDLTKADSRTKYHTVLLRGFNEGFADVWGWIYTGDAQFVGRSLPSQKLTRDMDTPLFRLEAKDEVLNWVELSEKDSLLLGESYLIGNELARAVRTFANLYSAEKKISLEETRIRIGQALIKSLPVMRDKYAALAEDQYLAPIDALAILTDQMAELGPTECYFMAKLAPLTDRTDVFQAKCKALEKTP